MMIGLCNKANWHCVCLTLNAVPYVANENMIATEESVKSRGDGPSEASLLEANREQGN